MEYEFCNYPILAKGKWDKNVFDLSEQYFAWVVQEWKEKGEIGDFWIEIPVELAEGTTLRTGMKIAKEEGSCTEKIWPYEHRRVARIKLSTTMPPMPIEAETNFGPPPESAEQQAKLFAYPHIKQLEDKGTYGFSAYFPEEGKTRRYLTGLSNSQMNKINASLKPSQTPGQEQGHIVPFAVPIFYGKEKLSDRRVRLFLYLDDNTGEFLMPQKAEDKGAYILWGFHAMDLIGYKDDHYILRNSWGKPFGYECEYHDPGKKGGYGTIPSEYLSKFCTESLLSTYQPKHTLDFDPEKEETWLIEDGHYPIAGDKHLDEELREQDDWWLITYFPENETPLNN
jgi:hypothetical protein